MTSNTQRRRQPHKPAGTQYVHAGCKVVHFSAEGIARCIGQREQQQRQQAQQERAQPGAR